MLSHPGLHLVVLRLRTSRSSDGRVGEVHMRRHGARIRRSTGIRVGEVVGRAGRWDAMRWRRPAQTRHVRAPVDAIRAVVIVGRRLQGLRRTVARGIGCHGGSNRRRTAEARKRRRGSGGRGTRAGLRKVTTEVGRDGSASVIIADGTRHMQGWKVTSRRHRGVMRGRGGRVDRAVL